MRFSLQFLIYPAGLVIAMFSMPFIKGQTLGFIAGLALVAFFTACYPFVRATAKRKAPTPKRVQEETAKRRRLLTEFSEEIHHSDIPKK